MMEEHVSVPLTELDLQLLIILLKEAEKSVTLTTNHRDQLLIKLQNWKEHFPHA